MQSNLTARKGIDMRITTLAFFLVITGMTASTAAAFAVTNNTLDYDQNRALQKAEKDMRNIMLGVQNASSTHDRDVLISRVERVEAALGQVTFPADEPRLVAVMNEISSAMGALTPAESPSSSPTVDTAPAAAAASETVSAPEFPGELERIEDFANAYNKSGQFHFGAEENAALWSTLADNREWIDSFPTRYASLFAADPQALNLFEVKAKWARRNMESFESDIANAAAGYIGELEAHFSEIADVIAQCRENRNAMFLEGSTRQLLGWAKDKLVVVQGSPAPLAEAASLQKAFDGAVADVASARADLEEEILAATRMPSDAYHQDDRVELQAMIEAGWSKNYPGEEILAIVFHNGSWNHEEGIRWDRGYERWERYDRDTLAVKVIVREDDRVAVMYAAFINRDNLASTVNAGVSTRDGDYVVERMLLENVE